MSFKAYTKEKEIKEKKRKKLNKEISSDYEKLYKEFNNKYPKAENKLDFFRRKRIWKIYKDSFFNNIKEKLGWK